MAPRGLIQTKPKTGGGTGASTTPGKGIEIRDGVAYSNGVPIQWNTNPAPVSASAMVPGGQYREVPVVSAPGQPVEKQYVQVGGTGYQTTTQLPKVTGTASAAPAAGGMSEWQKFIDEQRKLGEQARMREINAANAPTAADRLAQQEFEFTKEQNRLARERAGRGALEQGQNIQELLRGGATDYQRLQDLLTQQQTTSEGQINTQYQNALAELNRRRQTSQDLTASGFATAAEALQRAPQAFAGAERAQAAQLEPSAVERYAQLTGVPTETIQQTAIEAATGDQQAVNNYNRLLDFMQTQDTAAQQSRQLENQMAQAIATAQLETLYGGATSDLEREKLAGLADVYNQIQAQRFGVTQAEIGRKQQLQDALNAVLGTGEVTLDEPSGNLTSVTPLPEAKAPAGPKPLPSPKAGAPKAGAPKAGTPKATTPSKGKTKAQIAADQKAENAARAKAKKEQEDKAAAAAKKKADAEAKKKAEEEAKRQAALEKTRQERERARKAAEAKAKAEEAKKKPAVSKPATKKSK